jgi:hypothetical protein
MIWQLDDLFIQITTSPNRCIQLLWITRFR